MAISRARRKATTPSSPGAWARGWPSATWPARASWSPKFAALDPQQDRPLLAGVDSGLSQYSRLANLLLARAANARHDAGAGRPAAVAAWPRPRLARPGTPAWRRSKRSASQRLGEQLLLFGRGSALGRRRRSGAASPRKRFTPSPPAPAGFVFPSQQPLAIDTGPAALRTDAMRLVNMELRLLEPWIAAGQVTEELAAGDGSLQVSVLATDRSRLLLLTQHAPAQQFVLGPPPRSSLSVVVPGVGVSDQAYLVSLAGIKDLRISHTSSGAPNHARRRPARRRRSSSRKTPWRCTISTARWPNSGSKPAACGTTSPRAGSATPSKSTADSTELGHPLAAAAGWLRDAHAILQQAAAAARNRAISKTAHAATTKAEHLLASVRRGHWEQTAAAFPSPAASPCVAQFTTLPLHWAVAERIQPRPMGTERAGRRRHGIARPDAQGRLATAAACRATASAPM